MQDTSTITIMQHNTNKSKDKALLPFLQALEGKECSLIAIQEP